MGLWGIIKIILKKNGIKNPYNSAQIPNGTFSIGIIIIRRVFFFLHSFVRFVLFAAFRSPYAVSDAIGRPVDCVFARILR